MNYKKLLKDIEKNNSNYNIFEKKIIDFIRNYLSTDFLKGTGSVGDKGIGAVYFVKGANKLTLFQFKMGKPSNKLSFDDTQGIINKVKRFITNSKNMLSRNTELSEISSDIHRGKIKEIDLYVFSTNKYTKDVRKGFENPERDIIEMDHNKNIRIKLITYLFDNEGFFEMIHNLKTNKNFNESVKGKEMIFQLDAEKYIEHSKDEAYTLSVLATDLHDHILDLIRSPKNIGSLTHKNVRDFLGQNSSDEDISKGIARTLSDQKEGRDLYAYHMGMVVLCEDLKKEENKLIVASPSFVNGAQSLGTLMSFEKSKINKEASFTVRFVKAPSTNYESKEFSDKIVLRTNSSNPITPQMKYAFDPKQSEIARIFEERGFYYDYRAAEKNFKTELKKEVKQIKSFIAFDEEDKISEFLKYEKKLRSEVKPDEVAAAIYAVQKNDVKAQRSNKNVFRYSSNLDSEYYSVFYKNKKTRSFLEYFLPFAVHKVFLGVMDNVFTTKKDSVVIDYKKKQFKLDFNQAKKVQWLFFIEFLKEKEIKKIEDFVDIFNKEDSPCSFFKKNITKYLNKVNEDLIDKSSKETTVKKFLISKKVNNMADAVR